MSIDNKTDAINYINGDITSGVDNSSNLDPVPYSSPIKYTNFSNFWKDFINYLFPTTSSDLYGKSPIFGAKTNAFNHIISNTDYSVLKYQAIVPIGGIIMYGGSGTNTNNSGTIIPDPTIEGYLYCDGSVINNSGGNKKYEKLGNIIGQSFYDPEIHGGTMTPGYIYLPDFRSKTPVGYNAGVEHIGETGGANTYKITQENLPAIPDHTHVLNSDATSGGDAILTISATTNDAGDHYHALMYGDGQNYVKFTEAVCESIITTHLYATATAHKANENGFGESLPTIGSLGTDVNYYVLYPTTHENAYTHTHTVNSITSTLTGNTGNVVPYEKQEQTQIDMRPAYLVTNFIIKY